ncbi:unnamed protein product [Lactuca saligna]|uniref:Uncharacterized protein n=1 Tax=Lactuca saligna TaxID=75948 RepID=A0AA35ZLR9_LACSI|nr:unnamed protein product [Lactuca saligna]
MSKEVQKMEKNYTLLHKKVDVIMIAITKSIEFNTEYLNKLEAKSEKDSQIFENMEESLSSIKESILKVDILNQSKFSQDSISKLISTFETNIKSELDPILELVSSTQIPTSLPILLTMNSTITTTTRAMEKGISINEGAGGSSSSSVPPTSNDNPSNKGKAIYVVPSEEEKKNQQDLEIEKQRQTNSILI